MRSLTRRLILKLIKIKNVIKEFLKNLFSGKGGQESYLQTKLIEEHKNEMLLKYYNHYPLTF